MVDTVSTICAGDAWTLVSSAKASVLLKPRIVGDIPQDFYVAVAASTPTSDPVAGTGTDWYEVKYQSYGFLIDGMTTENVYVFPKNLTGFTMEVVRG